MAKKEMLTTSDIDAMKSKHDIDGLTEALNYAMSDADRRRIASRTAEALDELQWRPQRDRTGALYWMTKKRWSKCAEIGPDAVAPLLSRIGYGWSPISSFQKGPVKALGEIGDPRATDALVSLLISSENQGYEERDALIKIGGKKAIKKLKRVAKNKTNKNAVRYHAIQVLG
ncbi:MAG: hypothetical protein PVH17_11280, partial [Anaerolineae bacterium]